MCLVSPFRVTTGRVGAANAWSTAAAITWEGPPQLSGDVASKPAAACLTNGGTLPSDFGLEHRRLAATSLAAEDGHAESCDAVGRFVPMSSGSMSSAAAILFKAKY